MLPQSYHLVRGPGEGTFSLVGNIQYAAAGFAPAGTTLSGEAAGLCYTQGGYHVQQVTAGGGAGLSLTHQPINFTAVARPQRYGTVPVRYQPRY